MKLECRSRLRKESTIFAEAGAGPGVGFLNENRIRCQAKFLTSAKFLTCYCFSVILIHRVKK